MARQEFKQFNTIAGLSESRRLPRAGKIRLGIKAKSKKGTEYPKDVDYFVCSDEVKKIYGEQPKILDVMMPMEDTGFVFPQSYKRYKGNQLLVCKGNGIEGVEWNGKEQKEVPCPCPYLDSEKRECQRRASLMVILPRITLAGVYQIDTGSVNNILNINSDLDYIRGMLGKISWIHLKLHRTQEEIHFEGKKVKKHLLHLRFDGRPETVARIRGGAIPAFGVSSKQPPSLPDKAPAEPDQPMEMERLETVGKEDIEPAPPPPVVEEQKQLPPPPAKSGRKMHLAQKDFLNNQLKAVVDEDDYLRVVDVVEDKNSTFEEAVNLITELTKKYDSQLTRLAREEQTTGDDSTPF